MHIEVREVKGRNELREFIYLPEKIHRDHPGWVHPLYIDEWVFFDQRRNKSFSGCETVLAIAWSGRKAVGRIMGIINRRYNDIHNENNARFCFMECYEDYDVASALVRFITGWAKDRGMSRLIGPLGFSDKDPQGFMTEGFDEDVLIATYYNFPWMVEFIEKLGFSKEVDLVSYKVRIPDKVPEYFERVYNRVIVNNGYRVCEFDSRRSLRPWIVPVFRLINETYNHIYGFIPMEEKEMQEMAGRYLPVLNPRFIKIITNGDDELIAFVVSMPELSRGIRRARGRLFPVGWYRIYIESRKTRLLTMLLGAIKEEYRGRGLDSILAVRLLQSAWESGMQIMDSHLILEHNTRMRSEYERIGGQIHKRYRVFGKAV